MGLAAQTLPRDMAQASIEELRLFNMTQHLLDYYTKFPEEASSSSEAGAAGTVSSSSNVTAAAQQQSLTSAERAVAAVSAMTWE